jgi:hypothetical protein
MRSRAAEPQRDTPTAAGLTTTRIAALAVFGVAMLLLSAPATWASAVIARPSSVDSLSWHGGPVVDSSAPYLVYWTPSGEGIPASSRSLVERYLTDVAADSGRSSNVFAVDRQYYDRAGFAAARETFNPARQAIVDTQPYPPQDASQCPGVAAAYPTCVSDPQIRSELQRLITADRLPTAGPASASELAANTPIYLIIAPGDVNVCFLAGTRCFATTDCSYHAYFVDNHGDNVLYAVIPMQIHGPGFHGVVWPKVCQYDNNHVVQEPNGDVADVVLTHLSHELNETITDPINQISGWFDTSGNEDGDLCNAYGPFIPAGVNNANAFSPTLGGSETAGTLYTQLINGDRYYTQSEWSNGDGNCEMRPSPGRVVPRFRAGMLSKAHAAIVSLDPRASASTHPLSSATWDLGDRSRTAFSSGNGVLAIVKHRYRSAGHYTVTLTLVDDRGNMQTTTRRVNVRTR